MNKIPTLFKRNDKGQVEPLPNGPVAEHILSVPTFGVPTRKYDGTAIRIDAAGVLWKRYTVKHNKPVPRNFIPTGEPAPGTGKQPGWVRVNLDNPDEKYLREAIDTYGTPSQGTYELCGPKINGNPEGLCDHRLIPHGKELLGETPREFEGLRVWLSENPIEGIVWWHDGQPIAKLKGRDFGISRSS